jgi:hypothetical protein
MNTPQNDGGAAFPESASGSYPNGEIVPGRPGMTLRDYFAAGAMSAMLGQDAKGNWSNDKIAEWAYDTADAMLAQRNRL